MNTPFIKNTSLRAPSLRLQKGCATIEKSSSVRTGAHYNKTTESGSVFVYILLAVALFAALTYAVSRDNNPSTNIFTDEQAKLAAQEIIAYGNTVATAVQKLKLRGFKDTEIGFGNSVFTDGDGALIDPPGHNPNCTSNTCEVFSTEGGGLNPTIVNGHTDFNQSAGHSWFKAALIDSVGSSATDLIMQVQHITEAVCIQINNILGVSASNSLPIADSFDTLNFDGSYPTHTDPLGDVATELSGTQAHCAVSNGVGYRFNQVLIAR